MLITLDGELKRKDPIKEIRKLFGEDPSREIDLESGHFSTVGAYPIPRASYSPKIATRLRGNPGIPLRGNPTNNNDFLEKLRGTPLSIWAFLVGLGMLSSYTLYLLFKEKKKEVEVVRKAEEIVKLLKKK